MGKRETGVVDSQYPAAETVVRGVSRWLFETDKYLWSDLQ